MFTPLLSTHIFTQCMHLCLHLCEHHVYTIVVYTYVYTMCTSMFTPCLHLCLHLCLYHVYTYVNTMINKMGNPFSDLGPHRGPYFLVYVIAEKANVNLTFTLLDYFVGLAYVKNPTKESYQNIDCCQWTLVKKIPQNGAKYRAWYSNIIIYVMIFSVL